MNNRAPRDSFKPDSLRSPRSLTDIIVAKSGLCESETAMGGYEMVCKDGESVGLLNETACGSMQRHMPE